MGNLTTGFKKFLQNKNTVTVVGVILAIVVLYFAYTIRIKSAINPIQLILFQFLMLLNRLMLVPKLQKV